MTLIWYQDHILTENIWFVWYSMSNTNISKINIIAMSAQQCFVLFLPPVDRRVGWVQTKFNILGTNANSNWGSMLLHNEDSLQV